MAIVLPQGRFNNTSDQHVREFIAARARILAIVSLHGNTFKPHTGTKTSVLFAQKWNDDPSAGPLCRKVNNYSVFLAVSEKGGKDNSGDYVFLENNNGQHKLDKNGHLIVDHDLHNHNEELRDGNAEAFIEWAKRENFKFLELNVSEYYPPRYQSKQFHCPYCQVFASQDWGFTFAYDEFDEIEKIHIEKTHVEISICSHCDSGTFWLGEKIIYPPTRSAPPANSDLPDNVKQVYEEAAAIVDQSPRAACALLRFAVEMLMQHLGETGSINESIGNLVKRGLRPGNPAIIGYCKDNRPIMLFTLERLILTTLPMFKHFLT